MEDAAIVQVEHGVDELRIEQSCNKQYDDEIDQPSDDEQKSVKRSVEGERLSLQKERELVKRSVEDEQLSLQKERKSVKRSVEDGQSNRKKDLEKKYLEEKQKLSSIVLEIGPTGLALSREELIKIYEDTQQKCKDGKYSHLKVPESLKFFTDDIKSVKMTKLYDRTIIEVVNTDTIAMCKLLSDMGNKNGCGLNMCSKYNPGGGVLKGSRGAQEENLFRRTNYHLTLENKYYPMNSGECTLSPNLYVLKNEKYDDIKDPFSISFIAAAAVKHPATILDEETGIRTYKNKKDRDDMTSTIDMVFKVAYGQGYDTLVLSAFGCGAYGNPPNEVINIFNKFLEEYYGCFQRIVFAIYSRGVDRNYNLFNKGIKTKFT
jgi:uncharacterized protein (TIGR02452 family)